MNISSAHSSNDGLSFLQNTGQVGEEIRAFHWSKTTLSMPAAWPQSLQTALGILLRSPVPMFLFWGVDFIQFYNDAARLHLQATGKQHPIGQPAQQSLKDEWDLIHPLFLEVQKGNVLQGVDKLPPQLDGNIAAAYRPFSYSPVYGEDSTVAGILLTAIQTTEKTITQARAEEVLATSERRKRLYDTIISSTPDLVYVFNLDYTFAYANEALLTMWGRTWDTAIGLGLRPLGYEEWHAQMHEREIDHIVHTKQPVRGTVSFPHATLGKRIYDYILVPVLGEDGDVEAVAGTTRDITDLKRGEEALRESEERYRNLAAKLEHLVAERTQDLLRSNEELLQFAHVASHDLKEPVRKIQIFTNMLAAGNEVRSEQGRINLDKVQSAAARMATMITGVLAYSTLNATEQPIERIDLNKTIADIVTDLEVIMQQKGAMVTYDALPAINGAPVLIYQLFYNLINNSLKFSKEDVPPLIRITGEADENTIRITVQDNGIGFEPLYEEDIFKTFLRLNSKDQYEGTGLGLSLCKRIVQRHSGTITAKGQAGIGAFFIITLPE